MNKEHSKNTGWTVCYISAIVLVFISFTPAVMPANISKPQLFGFPYTLWTGIIVSITLVSLTFIAAKYFNQQENLEK